MHEPSPVQKAYLARQKKDRRLVTGARLLVFVISWHNGKSCQELAGLILLFSAVRP